MYMSQGRCGCDCSVVIVFVKSGTRSTYVDYCYHDDKSINSNLNVNKIILTQMILISYSGIVHLIWDLLATYEGL